MIKFYGNLFDNFNDEDFKCFVNYFGSKIQTYNQNNIIYLAGDYVDKFGIILSGSVNVVNTTSNVVEL